jgi:hypothetical protein
MLDEDTGQKAMLDALVLGTTAELGLSRPLDLKVLRAASGDPEYAQSLAGNRGDTKRLQQLVENPPEMPDASEGFSDLDLALHGARVLWSWLRDGRRTASEDERARRLSICRACPDVRELPATWLYALAAVGVTEPLLCGKCGCVLERKAQMTVGSCPSEDPARPGLDRWGQPFRRTE